MARVGTVLALNRCARLDHMSVDFERRWLADMAAEGDHRTTALYGYERLISTWAVDLPNGLPEHLVYLLVAGAIDGVVAGRSTHIRPGTLLWVPPRTSFHLGATGRRAPRLYRFRLTPHDLDTDEVRIIDDAWSLRETMADLIAELDGRLALRTERIRGLLVVLFSGIFRLSATPQGLPPLPPDTRQALEEFAEHRLADRPSVDDLARVASLSPDYFTRRFRATFGIPPRQWLVRHRIRHAMLRLEETDDTITAIADRLGYQDVVLFSRQFASVVGTSPRAWRQGRR